MTISLPKELKEEIEKAAKADKRSISNYLVNELARVIAKSGGGEM